MNQQFVNEVINYIKNNFVFILFFCIIVSTSKIILINNFDFNNILNMLQENQSNAIVYIIKFSLIYFIYNILILYINIVIYTSYINYTKNKKNINFIDNLKLNISIKTSILVKFILLTLLTICIFSIIIFISILLAFLSYKTILFIPVILIILTILMYLFLICIIIYPFCYLNQNLTIMQVVKNSKTVLHKNIKFILILNSVFLILSTLIGVTNLFSDSVLLVYIVDIFISILGISYQLIILNLIKIKYVDNQDFILTTENKDSKIEL